jgi:hypothetical protein
MTICHPRSLPGDDTAVERVSYLTLICRAAPYADSARGQPQRHRGHADDTMPGASERSAVPAIPSHHCRAAYPARGPVVADGGQRRIRSLAATWLRAGIRRRGVHLRHAGAFRTGIQAMTKHRRRRPGQPATRDFVRAAWRAASVAGAAVAAFGPQAAFAATGSQILAVDSIATVIANLTAWIVGILAAVATLFLTIGGLRYLAAGGDPGEVERAKTALKSAAIGYGLAILAPVIVGVLKSLVGG